MSIVLQKESPVYPVSACCPLQANTATAKNGPCFSLSSSEGFNLFCSLVSKFICVVPSPVLGLAVPGGEVDAWRILYSYPLKLYS